MSIYKRLGDFGQKYIKKHTLFKQGFNWSPMYRRSTGKIIEISEDLMDIRIKLPISYKNRNYANSIFGGSMFSATDPISMVQLINIIGDDYVVWDKSAQIFFKRPAREDLYADFNFTASELDEIRQRVAQENEIDITKTVLLTNEDRSVTYCEVHKVIYVADKEYYKNKRRNRKKIARSQV